VNEATAAHKRHRGGDTAGRRTRVLLVDDHDLVRRGLRAVVEQLPGMRVVGEASNGHSALERAESLHPDVVIVDLSMPDMDGFALLREIRRRYPTMKSIVVSMHTDESAVREALNMGAAAYVIKDTSADEIALALQAIRRGALYISGSVSRFAAGTPSAPLRDAAYGVDQLTPRQREILSLVASGFTTQAIAHQLNISVKTVETHRAQLMARLDLHDVASLVRFAIREGLVSAD
jgi:DNA-binding NarL/FixJ family response regulator